MSGRARIAPVLSALLEDLEDLANGAKPNPKASKEGDRQVIRLAKEDLRNLLAVARLMAAQVKWTTRHSPNLKDSPRLARCRRALARLERAAKK